MTRHTSRRLTDRLSIHNALSISIVDSTMPTSTPKLDVILLLDAYQNAHLQGNSNLKASWWSLTKARREKPEIAASNVRQELEPTLRMEQVGKDSEEPELMQERLSLVDVVQKQQQDKENPSNTTAPNTNTTNATSESNTGLRNRHSKKDYSASTTSEEKASMIKEDMVDNATVIPDPLQLFGGALPPRSLHAAQTQAKQALESYIQAATMIQELQLIMRDAK
jgi:hypothetical protein